MIKLRQLLLSLMLLLTATVALGHNTGDKNDTERRYNYFYLEAITHKLNEDFGSAYNLLNHCIALCPERPEAYYDRASIFNAINKPEAALNDFEKAFSLNKSEKIYKRSVFYQTLMTGDYLRAASIGEELCEQTADLQIYSILLSIYSTQKDYDGMLRTLENIEEINGTDENTTLAKMQIFERRGEKNRAYEELKKLSDSNPRETSYKVMLGNWLLQNNRPDDAYNVYKGVLDSNPDDLAANMSMLDYYRETGKNVEADVLAEKLLMGTTVPGESKILIMNQLIQNIEKEGNDSTKVLGIFDKILSSPGADADMAEMKAAYMTVKKMPKDTVVEALRYALNIDPTRLSVRLQLLQEYWNKKDFASVIKYSQPTEEYQPTDITVYYFLGLAYLLTDNDDKSLEAMLQGTEYINDESNALIVSDVYSVIGDLFHSKGQNDDAYGAYDKCLEYNENNIGCLNNYAYYLSLEERNMDKAEEMSRKTIIAEPSNNTYLDTYAWILFLQKKYSEAKIYIEQLLENVKDGEEMGAVICDHIGDIYIMNGDAEKAVKYWKLAKTAGSDNKVIDSKIKKVKYIPEKKK